MIQRAVASHVKVIHQTSTAWTQSHRWPEDWTSDETEALVIEVEEMLSGE
jgi:hypothetical protein